jgi:translocon-associated protein subunit beta
VCARTRACAVYIYKLRDYERKFSPHYIDWVIFFLMASPCIGLPAVLWFQTYKKYDLLAQKKTK